MKAFILFFLLALFYFFPNPSHFFTHILGISQWPEDTMGVLYLFWCSRNFFELGIFPDFNPFLAAPFGVSVESGLEKIIPICTGLTYLLTGFFNEVFAYNLFTLLGVSLSAWAMSELVWVLTGSRLAGVFSGLIYGFSPNLFCQALAGHLAFTHAQWIPLYTLFLWKFLERPTFLKATMTSLLFAVIWLSTPYFGFFAFYFTLLFLFWRFAFFERRLSIALIKIFSLIGIFSISFLLILPFTMQVILNALNLNSVSEAVSGTFIRSFRDLVKYGARPWDYLFPSELNSVLGPLARRTQEAMGGRNLFERNLYLGLTPLFLASYALWAWGKKRIEGWSREKTFFISVMVVCGFSMIIFSFPPYLIVGIVEIPMPSAFFYRFFPMFRVYARVGFFVSMCLAALAGLGFSFFVSRRKRGWTKIFFSILFFVLLVFEYTLVPPPRNVDVSTVPAVYQWLKKQSGDFIVAEYPLHGSIDIRHFTYLSYQRFHGKRLINGAPDSTPAHWLIDANRDLWQKKVPSRLASLGVKYAVFHKQEYRENVQKRVLRSEGLKLIREFPDEWIFEVVAKPEDITWVAGNIYPPEPGLEGRNWAWVSGNGGFVFYKRSLGKFRFRLKFLLTSHGVPREVKIVLEGMEISRFVVEPGKVTAVDLNDLSVDEGLYTILMKVSPRVEALSDGREVSVAISEFELIPSSLVTEGSIMYDPFIESIMVRS